MYYLINTLFSILILILSNINIKHFIDSGKHNNDIIHSYLSFFARLTHLTILPTLSIIFITGYIYCVLKKDIKFLEFEKSFFISKQLILCEIYNIDVQEHTPYGIIADKVDLANLGLKKLPIKILKCNTLILTNNKLKSFENVPISLNELYLENNDITDISNLKIILNCLIIDNNRIKKLDLSGIKGLDKICYLSASNCGIVSVENLNIFSQVNLSNNNIENISNINGTYYVLILANNKITKYDANFEFSFLDLSGNEIKEVLTKPKYIPSPFKYGVLMNDLYYLIPNYRFFSLPSPSNYDDYTNYIFYSLDLLYLYGNISDTYRLEELKIELLEYKNGFFERIKIVN